MDMIVHIVAAFSDEPDHGNPAGVCLLNGPLDGPEGEAWMQRVAREVGLSETAFLYKEDQGLFALRWFTPLSEVALCGHATLAAAHVLRWYGLVGLSGQQRISFNTKSGELSASFSGQLIVLDFPPDPLKHVSGTAALAAALGVSPINVERGRFDYLVELSSEDEVRRCTPDLTALSQIETRGVAVTARAEQPIPPRETEPSQALRYDFISRFFAPRIGIDEDPVTGSAHCMLGPYWAKKLGKERLHAYQASERGGSIGVTLKDDRVYLTGRAVTYNEMTFSKE